MSNKRVRPHDSGVQQRTQAHTDLVQHLSNSIMQPSVQTETLRQAAQLLSGQDMDVQHPVQNGNHASATSTALPWELQNDLSDPREGLRRAQEQLQHVMEGRDTMRIELRELRARLEIQSPRQSDP